ncbi:hypothetical protein GCM10009096_27730 [Parasphingorhabdus litoris]|uniref:Glycosyl hydrolase n=1 Tax=Parasphingorhabdus litoris TaxID=394733 RepID=A0ABN1ATQ7_9SPHN|nr:hypothetical protein [Parasphingorhabdus litoris]
MKIYSWIVAAALIATPVFAKAQNQSHRDDQADISEREHSIRQAMAETAHYVSTVLIQPSGKGRTDYDLVSGKWSDYETHWHTGQAIWGLVESAALLNDPSLEAAAKRAGDWWISTEYQDLHPFAGLVDAAHGNRLGPLLNWTTIADGTPGLFALSRATGDPRYADSATRSGKWLWRNTRVPDSVKGGEGLFYNIFDPSRGVVVTDWNPHKQGAVYDQRVDYGSPPIEELARPNIEGFLFADMCRHTGDRLWCDRFLEQAEFALARQHANGLWMEFEPNDPKTGNVHPRFNIWNAEALLEAYALTSDNRFLDGAERTATFYRDIATKDGTIHYRLNTDGTAQRGSITGSAVAFNGILMLRLRDYGKTGFDKAINRTAKWLAANRFSPDHADPNIAGAVINTRYKTGGGKAQLIQRDVGSTFALRFMALYLRDLRGENVNAHLTGSKSP